MMRKRTSAQLNAINRAYTRKRQKKALIYLEDQGINFDLYCKMFKYKASPVKLAGSIENKQGRTMWNILKYMDKYHKGDKPW